MKDFIKGQVKIKIKSQTILGRVSFKYITTFVTVEFDLIKPVLTWL
jgi:hypothetical protein